MTLGSGTDNCERPPRRVKWADVSDRSREPGLCWGRSYGAWALVDTTWAGFLTLPSMEAQAREVGACQRNGPLFLRTSPKAKLS